MRYRTVFAYAVACAAFGMQARAQDIQAPTDTDLKAAYCTGVTQQEIVEMPQGMPESVTQGDQDRLQHLQAYVVPRMQFVDPLGLAAARKRGQRDAKVIADPAMLACTQQCSTTQSNVDALRQCVLTCDTQQRLPRIWACNDLSWLPF